MRDFMATAHYIPLPPEEVAAQLGWTIGEELDDEPSDESDEEDGRPIFQTPNGKTCYVESLPVGAPNTVVSLVAHHYQGEIYQALVERFGDTSLPQNVRDELVAWLETKNLIASRRVLVENENGTDAVVVETGLNLDVSLAGHILGDGCSAVRFNCFNFDGAKPIDNLPADGLRLEVAEYPTIADVNLIWDVPETEGLCDYAIELLLQQHAIGPRHIYAVLSGPLECSQSSCYQVETFRHLPDPGFVAQFLPPQGQHASFLYMVSNDNGALKIVPHAI